MAINQLKSFWEKYPNAEQPLLAWIDEVRDAACITPADIKQHFATASILKSRRVVFNIKGNDFRLIVAVAYRFGAVYIKFIGTHKQYDTVNADNVEME
jgi:mRNA interferase HigB